jgi:hypothetical protein
MRKVFGILFLAALLASGSVFARELKTHKDGPFPKKAAGTWVMKGNPRETIIVRVSEPVGGVQRVSVAITDSNGILAAGEILVGESTTVVVVPLAFRDGSAGSMRARVSTLTSANGDEESYLHVQLTEDSVKGYSRDIVFNRGEDQ